MELFTLKKREARYRELLENLYEDISDGTFDFKNNERDNRASYLNDIKTALKEGKE